MLKKVWFLKLQSGFIEKNIVQAWGKWLEMKERHVRNLKWSWKVYIDLKTAEEIIFENVASDIFGKSIIHRLHVMTRIWFDMIWMVDLTSVPVMKLVVREKKLCHQIIWFLSHILIPGVRLWRGREEKELLRRSRPGSSAAWKTETSSESRWT